MFTKEIKEDFIKKLKDCHSRWCYIPHMKALIIVVSVKTIFEKSLKKNFFDYVTYLYNQPNPLKQLWY